MNFQHSNQLMPPSSLIRLTQKQTFKRPTTVVEYIQVKCQYNKIRRQEPFLRLTSQLRPSTS